MEQDGTWMVCTSWPTTRFTRFPHLGRDSGRPGCMGRTRQPATDVRSGVRTRDLLIGNQMLYLLSHSHVQGGSTGFEPATDGFTSHDSDRLSYDPHVVVLCPLEESNLH